MINSKNPLTVQGFLLWVALAVPTVYAPMSAMGQATYTTPYTITTLAGIPGVAGTNDGQDGAAHFNYPGAIALDRAGNLFIGDLGNNTIRKMSPAGVVTTLAGWPQFDTNGSPVGGSDDGTGSAARFNEPSGLALDGKGNVYVADTGNHTIRKVRPAGTNWVVTTIAGMALNDGHDDGTNSDARFYYPAGVALDTNGNIYVADQDNCAIRKVTPVGTNWVVTTLAGLPGPGGMVGTNDGTNSGARFSFPVGVAVDTNGNIYVADTYNSTIRKVTPSGTNWVVTTLAGLPGLGFHAADGTNSDALFSFSRAVAVDTVGNLFVADSGNESIRKVTPEGTNWVVTTLAGLSANPGINPGTNDGTGNVARFRSPEGLTVDANGNVYVADTDNHTIRKGFVASSVPPPVLQGPAVSGGLFGFGITGLPNLAVDVQASSDLTNWQTLGSNYYVLVNGTNFFPGPSPAQGNEFYRVRVR